MDSAFAAFAVAMNGFGRERRERGEKGANTLFSVSDGYSLCEMSLSIEGALEMSRAPFEDESFVSLMAGRCCLAYHDLAATPLPLGVAPQHSLSEKR